MFKGRNDWEELWMEDKQSVIDTMVKNMVADLVNGYDYFGACIARQRDMIDKYQKDYADQLMVFATMDDKAINKWCYYDMKRRGAIE